MNRYIIIFLLLLIFQTAAHADILAYGGTHKITTSMGTLVFRHVHNWNSPKVSKLFFNLPDHERFFSSANNFAFVEVENGDRVLFRSPSPALTFLWISPDANFFVGMSDIMLHNPYQLVVWSRDGTVVHREHISSRVAKLSAEQRCDFANRYPKAERFLADRYFTHGDATYLDYAILGVPNEIGLDAFDFLQRLDARHPYSDDFCQSVTNRVHWFDDTNPVLSINPNGTELILRSPTGKRMTVPLTHRNMPRSQFWEKSWFIPTSILCVLLAVVAIAALRSVHASWLGRRIRASTAVQSILFH